MAGGRSQTARTKKLERLLLLSIAAALATISLKTLAWALTDSVGLLSDAAEYLVAAVFALIVVRWAARPADEEHAYGHEKADYLSAGVEGSLILVAAGTIGYAAIRRLADPQPLDDVGVGLAVSILASATDFAVARILINVGRQERSLVLEADGRHLMTEVIRRHRARPARTGAPLTASQRTCCSVRSAIVACG